MFEGVLQEKSQMCLYVDQSKFSGTFTQVIYDF